jgi:alpha-ribazole phosphatase
MTPFDVTELILIRHAAAATGGRLCGRIDVPLQDADAGTLMRAAGALSGVRRVVTSPALRCRQTAAALFPGLEASEDARLWEQDFGDEDGVAYADLPDLGDLSRDLLAHRRPPSGESFSDMVARALPGLEAAAALARGGGPVAVVAHAGTVRAAIAHAIGSVPAALAFEIAPLSVTRLRCLPDGFAVVAVNVSV